MDSLTPTDLFSPSKARQQRAQAQDWAQIESWLSYKYSGRPIPTFERNDDTLKILRELALANERADEEKGLLERLERDALKECDERETNPDDERIIETITAYLTPSGLSSLHALASTAVALNTPSANPETIAHTLIQHTTTTQNLTNQLEHIANLTQYLEKQHTALRAQLADLQNNPTFHTPSSLPRQTTEQVRQTKHLRGKIKEYEDKLSGLQYAQGRARTNSVGRSGADASSTRALEDMLEQQMQLDALRDKVMRLEKQVDEFAGLPADREGARREVGKLEVELDAVRRRRDDMFGGLVG